MPTDRGHAATEPLDRGLVLVRDLRAAQRRDDRAGNAGDDAGEERHVERVDERLHVDAAAADLVPEKTASRTFGSIDDVTRPIDSAMLITKPLWMSIIRVPGADAALLRRHDAHHGARVRRVEDARTRADDQLPQGELPVRRVDAWIVHEPGQPDGRDDHAGVASSRDRSGRRARH